MGLNGYIVLFYYYIMFSPNKSIEIFFHSLSSRKMPPKRCQEGGTEGHQLSTMYYILKICQFFIYNDQNLQRKNIYTRILGVRLYLHMLLVTTWAPLSRIDINQAHQSPNSQKARLVLKALSIRKRTEANLF